MVTCFQNRTQISKREFISMNLFSQLYNLIQILAWHRLITCFVLFEEINMVVICLTFDLVRFLLFQNKFNTTPYFSVIPHLITICNAACFEIIQFSTKNLKLKPSQHSLLFVLGSLFLIYQGNACYKIKYFQFVS